MAKVTMSIHDVSAELFDTLASVRDVEEVDGHRWITIATPSVRLTFFDPPRPVVSVPEPQSLDANKVVA